MHFPISVASGRRKHHQNSSRTHIHPSKFLIPEEEDMEEEEEKLL
jgi:hypothetical protein